MKSLSTPLAAVVAAALCACSLAARADDARPLTREQVIAQVLAARQSGELATLEGGGVWSPARAAAPVSRDAVVAEVLAARQSGELAVIEGGGAVPSHAEPAPLSRDQVTREFMKTREAAPDALALEHSL